MRRLSLQGIFSYLAGSDLIAMVSNGTLKVTRTYEAKRDLVTAVQNETTNLVSRYGYEYDAIGRRTAVTNSGSAFSSSTNHFAHLYNDRGEPTNSTHRIGAATNAYGYAFDNIGNRGQSASNAQQTAYVVNQLNQYTRQTGDTSDWGQANSVRLGTGK